MPGTDNLIRLTEEQMVKLAELEGSLIDYEKEIQRAKDAGLSTDLGLDDKQKKMIEMRRKIAGIKKIYKPL